jgi:glycosyltransferase involved in cell wall biosynthesis
MTIELSVVVPLYDEEETVRELQLRLSQVLQSTGEAYEILFVNDGSRDATPRLIDELAEADAHVVALHLSRNFGHQAAVSAGLDRARGQAVVIMDGDLQDPPELIPEFLRLWRLGNDVVYAVRRKRKENALKRFGYFVFYRILGAIGDIAIPLDAGDFCLMDRHVADTLRRLPERCRFLRGLRTFVGFRQVGLEYERTARAQGRPKYTLPALFRLAADGLVSFSSFPLRLVSYLGIMTVGFALVLTLWVMADALVNHTAPRGWASLLLVVLFLGAVQLIGIGIIGEYLRLIFLEAKGRPSYIVDERRTRRREAAGVAGDEGDHRP